MLGFHLCYLGLKAMSPMFSPLVRAIRSVLGRLWRQLRQILLRQIHLYKILETLLLVNQQVKLLEVGEEIYKVLHPGLILVLFHIMEFILRKNSRKIPHKVELMVAQLLITPLDQDKEGPPLRLSQCPALAGLSTLVRLLAMDVAVGSPPLQEAHECGTVALQAVETSLVTVLRLPIGAIMNQISPLCGTVIPGLMGGIILLLHRLLSLLENADHPVHILLLHLVFLPDVIGVAIHLLICQEIVASGAQLKKKPTLNQEPGKIDRRKENVMTILLEIQTG